MSGSDCYGEEGFFVDVILGMEFDEKDGQIKFLTRWEQDGSETKEPIECFETWKHSAILDYKESNLERYIEVLETKLEFDLKKEQKKQREEDERKRAHEEAQNGPNRKRLREDSTEILMTGEKLTRSQARFVRDSVITSGRQQWDPSQPGPSSRWRSSESSQSLSNPPTDDEAPMSRAVDQPSPRPSSQPTTSGNHGGNESRWTTVRVPPSIVDDVTELIRRTTADEEPREPREPEAREERVQAVPGPSSRPLPVNLPPIIDTSVSPTIAAWRLEDRTLQKDYDVFAMLINRKPWRRFARLAEDHPLRRELNTEKLFATNFIDEEFFGRRATTSLIHAIRNFDALSTKIILHRLYAPEVLREIASEELPLHQILNQYRLIEGRNDLTHEQVRLEKMKMEKIVRSAIFHSEKAALWVVDERKDTLLHIAIRTGLTKLAQLLVLYGAPYHLTNVENTSLVDECFKVHDIHTFQLLCQHGAITLLLIYNDGHPTELIVNGRRIIPYLIYSKMATNIFAQLNRAMNWMRQRVMCAGLREVKPILLLCIRRSPPRRVTDPLEDVVFYLHALKDVEEIERAVDVLQLTPMTWEYGKDGPRVCLRSPKMDHPPFLNGEEMEKVCTHPKCCFFKVNRILEGRNALKLKFSAKEDYGFVAAQLVTLQKSEWSGSCGHKDDDPSWYEVPENIYENTDFHLDPRRSLATQF